MEPAATPTGSYRQLIASQYMRDLAGIQNGLLPLDGATFAYGRSAEQIDALAAICSWHEESFLRAGLMGGAQLGVDGQRAMVDICITAALSRLALDTLEIKWAVQKGMAPEGSDEGALDILARCDWNMERVMDFGWIGFKRQTPSLSSGKLAGVEGVAAFSFLMAVASDHVRALQRFASENPDCPWADSVDQYIFRMDAPTDI